MTRFPQRLTAEYELGWPYFPIIREVSEGLQHGGADLDVVEGRGHLSKIFYLSDRPVDVLRCVLQTKQRVAACKALTAALP